MQQYYSTQCPQWLLANENSLFRNRTKFHLHLATACPGTVVGRRNSVSTSTGPTKNRCNPLNSEMTVRLDVFGRHNNFLTWYTWAYFTREDHVLITAICMRQCNLNSVSSSQLKLTAFNRTNSRHTWDHITQDIHNKRLKPPNEAIRIESF